MIIHCDRTLHASLGSHIGGALFVAVHHVERRHCRRQPVGRSAFASFAGGQAARATAATSSSSFSAAAAFANTQGRWRGEEALDAREAKGRLPCFAHHLCAHAAHRTTPPQCQKHLIIIKHASLRRKRAPTRTETFKLTAANCELPPKAAATSAPSVAWASASAWTHHACVVLPARRDQEYRRNLEDKRSTLLKSTPRPHPHPSNVRTPRRTCPSSRP